MTKEEFHLWCDQHKREIMELYEEGKVPSIDRYPDTDGHYSINNIRVIDMRENLLEGTKKVRAKLSKKLIAKHEITGEILKFSSGIAAQKAGFSRSMVVACLSGKRARYRKFIWSYDKDPS